jgi:hypothetical protein
MPQGLTGERKPPVKENHPRAAGKSKKCNRLSSSDRCGSQALDPYGFVSPPFGGFTAYEVGKQADNVPVMYKLLL